MYKGFKKYFLKYLTAKKALKSSSYISELLRYEYKLQPRSPKIVERYGLIELRQLSKTNQPSYQEFSINMKSSIGSYIEDNHGNKVLNLDIGTTAPLGYNAVEMRKVINFFLTLWQHQIHGQYDLAIFQSFSLSSYPPQTVSDILRQQVMPIAPVGHNSIHFSEGNGSKAVQDAIRAVFQTNGGKGKILSFKNQSHGDTVSTQNIADSYNWPTIDLPKPMLPYLKNQARNHKEQQQSLRETQSIFESDQIAGLIVEPVNSTDFYSASPDYYKQLCRLCKQHGVKVVVNETQSCMGGAQSLWAHQSWNLEQQEVPDYVVFGGRAQQSGYFCRYEDRSKQQASEGSGDMKRLIQFTTVWKQFFERKDTILDLGTALQVELERVRSKSDWLVDNIRGSGAQVAFDCESIDMRQAIFKYLMVNGIKVGKAGEKSIVLRPSLELRAYDVGVFRDIMLNFDSSLARMIQGDRIFD